MGPDSLGDGATQIAIYLHLEMYLEHAFIQISLFFNNTPTGITHSPQSDFVLNLFHHSIWF